MPGHHSSQLPSGLLIELAYSCTRCEIRLQDTPEARVNTGKFEMPTKQRKIPYPSSEFGD